MSDPQAGAARLARVPARIRRPRWHARRADEPAARLERLVVIERLERERRLARRAGRPEPGAQMTWHRV